MLNNRYSQHLAPIAVIHHFEAPADSFFLNGTVIVLSAEGNSLGTGIETVPVAAHCVPLLKTVMKPTHS